MRVISQNGKSDIPYEYFVFSIVGNSNSYSIIATKNIAESPEVIMNSIFATYSTEAKAIKAMEMLREQHEKVAFLKTIINTEKGISFVRGLSKTDFDKMTQNYFQFPKDDEMEV
jgi:hypothetical protein|nr:MAG TPA: hypothetical protein [Bacteriophage sp.]